MKKLIFVFIGAFLILLGSTGVAYAASPDTVEAALSRVIKVFVTNWPSNQNVTVTNTSPIAVSSTTGQINWEYYSVCGWSGEEFFTNLPLKGQEGWEYIGAFNLGYSTPCHIFKRPLAQ